jgi:hypothetical protein
MTARALTYTGELAVLTCWCGMRHAVPEELSEYQMRAHRDEGREVDIYCPLGHTHVPAGTPAVEKERAARKAAEARATALADQLDAEKRAHTRTRTRVSKGVCPCCRRSFVNLARHMKGQHPDYADGAR